MCESNAYIEESGEETLFLEAVDILRPEGEIKEISLLAHRIVLRKIR